MSAAKPASAARRRPAASRRAAAGSRSTRRTTRRATRRTTRRRTPALATTVGTALGTLVVAAVLGASWTVRVLLVLAVALLGAGLLLWSRRADGGVAATDPSTPASRPPEQTS